MNFEKPRSPMTSARADAGDADAGAGDWKGGEYLAVSVIGHGILVKGDIEAKDDLRLEGRIIGNVRCHTLILGEGGSVAGNVYAERVRVAGTVKGSIETGDLAIEASGRVKGNATYSRVRIANGGIIDGRFKPRPAPTDEPAETPPRKVPSGRARLKLIEAPAKEQPKRNRP